jgi:SAM-dependent methyltransferase
VSHPERIIPDETEPGVVAWHLKRYEFAVPYCAGKDVLDAGCGAGYGSARLAEVARRVLGVDANEAAVVYARSRYAQQDLEFREGDLQALHLDDASFDVICAFETIEHLREPDLFLAHAVRLLRRPAGVMLVSTPRADETSERPENPFHEVELSRADFEALLRRFFPRVELYGQRRLQTARHRAMQRVDVLGLRRRLGFLRPATRLLGTPPTSEMTLDDIEIAADAVDSGDVLVALCAR